MTRQRMPRRIGSFERGGTGRRQLWAIIRGRGCMPRSDSWWRQPYDQRSELMAERFSPPIRRGG
jgi:hypothetical protein